MKKYLRALLMLLGMTLLTGIAYPVAITFLAETFAPEKARGSFIHKDGHVIGSRLIAQKFTSDRYFWPRPSAIDYNALSSGGSDFGQTSVELGRLVQEREKFLREKHPDVGENIPEDLLFASASGLDPHISQSAAYFQLGRVAHARKWNADQVELARRKIDKLVEHNPRVFPGEAGVNVLLLNLGIDQL